MSPDFEEMLKRYAELTVKVGLNLQPGQRLVITGLPVFNYGVSVQVAPLVRQLACSAYGAGARFVDVMWGDDEIQLVRLKHAPRDSFAEFPAWPASGMLEYVERGDAILSLFASNPDMLKDQDPELVTTVRETIMQRFQLVREYLARNATNWCIIAAAVPEWAAKIFPELPYEAQVTALWKSIFEFCRLNQSDPVSAWRNHIDSLLARCRYLNAKQYRALKFTAPGTALTIGLPKGHIWVAGPVTSKPGISFTPNLPTEEIFTLPDKDQTEGVVTATKPLCFGGTLIENLSLTFAGGRVTNMTAGKGETLLRRLVGTDEGAGRLGEVALVPYSTPISQSGLVFYNTLIDENAACHLALGQADKFCIEGDAALSDDEFVGLGGNHSSIHVDFMIGSSEMDIDGHLENGTVEPILRGGEWALEG